MSNKCEHRQLSAFMTYLTNYCGYCREKTQVNGCSLLGVCIASKGHSINIASKCLTQYSLCHFWHFHMLMVFSHTIVSSCHRPSSHCSDCSVCLHVLDDRNQKPSSANVSSTNQNKL